MNEKPSKIFHKVIRVPKEHSAFTYFILESNEGMCFYSTLESSLGKGYRDIEIKGDLTTQEETGHILDTLSKSYQIETLVDQVILDQRTR